MRNESKLVYIIGGSSGIGLASAKEFVRQGTNVVIFGRSENRLHNALLELDPLINNNQEAHGKTLDITNHKEVQNTLVKCVNEIGIPDVLINSAGISKPQYFEKVKYEEFDAVLKTNLYGIWSVCCVLVPHMKLNGGHIVNISSVAGLIGVFGLTSYSASKFGLIGFSESLRAELKQFNISVSILCPPDTDTPMLEHENKTKPIETKIISQGAKIRSANYVASEMIRQMYKGKFMIVPGMDSKIIALAKRFIPGIVSSVMDRKISKMK